LKKKKKNAEVFVGGLEPGLNRSVQEVDLENYFLNSRTFKAPASLLQARSHLFWKESNLSHSLKRHIHNK
jgi:hypothetical protein